MICRRARSGTWSTTCGMAWSATAINWRAPARPEAARPTSRNENHCVVAAVHRIPTTGIDCDAICQLVRAHRRLSDRAASRPGRRDAGGAAAPRQCQVALRYPLSERLLLCAVSPGVLSPDHPAAERRQDLPLGGLAGANAGLEQSRISGDTRDHRF